MCEDDGPQTREVHPGYAHALFKRGACIRSAHTCVDQRPTLFALEYVHIHGAQGEWDGDGDFPDIASYFPCYGLLCLELRSRFL